MTPDIGALADRLDPESRDVYVSLYVDLTDPRHDREIDRRAKELRAALGDERADALLLDESLALARKALARARTSGSPKGVAAFASAPHDWSEAHALAAPVDTRVVLDSSPYVRPLARHLDEYESFVLVLMDGESAAVYVVDAAKAERVASRSLDLLGRHKKGGWSQMRYQRGRQGVVDRFLDEIAERVRVLVEQDREAERIVVAGPGQAKRRFVDALTKDLQDKVIAVEDVDFTDDDKGALIDRFVKLARSHEAEESAEAVAKLRAELKRGELAVTGAFPTARAARNGQVDLLVVLKGAVAGGRKCEEHEAFFDADSTCPVGGERGTEVDLINEAVEGVARADGRVEFVDKDEDEGGFLEQVGGVGALLRW